MNPDQEPQSPSQPSLQHPEEPLNNVPLSQPVSAPNGDTPLPPLAPPDSSQVPAPSYAHPIPDKPGRTYNPKRFKLILIIVVAVCILAVGVMLAAALLPMSQKQNVTPETPKPTVPEKTVSAKTAIDHVKEYFKGDQAAKAPISLPVLSTNSAFYTVIPDIAPLVSVAGEVAPDKSEAQLSSIIHSLEGDEFTQRVSSNGANHTNFLADFTRKETYCEVSVTKPADTKANHWFEARCLDMATYVDYATAQKPLVDQYTPLTATSVQYGFVGKPAPTNSKTASYKLAELEVSIVVDNRMTSTGKFAQFYQTPDGLWHYFRDRDTSAVLDCDVYNTDSLKSAYLGVSCRDGKGLAATVQAPRAR